MKNWIKTIAVFCIVLAVAPLYAATNGIVKCKVVNEKNQPVEFASASLLHAGTLKLAKGGVCNDKGELLFEKVAPGEYVLSVSMMGYVKNEKEKLKIDPKDNPVLERTIILTETAHQLNDVVVKAKKQFIEQTVDKMVVNPEASITAAAENVYDILKKLPGVQIDSKDKVSLKGKDGVKILIDDKPAYVSAEQLATLLKSMQGKNVDRIEIIENPSARYDAEGNSGIINIKTKHNKAYGFNGSVNSGLNVSSRVGWNSGLDLNLNSGKVNVYGNYSLYNWAGSNGMDASRKFTSTSLQGASQLIHNDGKYDGSSHNYKVGADYFFAKNHVLSVMFRGNTGHNDNNDNNLTSFTDKYQHVDSTLHTISSSNNRWHNETYNANYKWDIDTTGQVLTVDVDYAHFYYRNPNTQHGEYQSATGSLLNHDVNVATLQGNSIDIYTAKADYVLPISKVFRFEAGLKTSFVTTDSYIGMEGTVTQNDHFRYQENIYAAYVNSNINLKKTMFQLGLRYEGTHSDGNSFTTNTVTRRTYNNLFPSFFVQQNLNKDNTINFNYSYRISRPSYDDLNPFRWMIDPYTYNVGNPNLQPQFTHAAGLSHNFKNMLITSVGFNSTNDLFTQIIRQNDLEKTVYQTMTNLNSAINLNASETFQLQPVKWWRLNGTLTGVYKKLKLDQGDNGALDQWSFFGNMSNTFNLPFKVDMEVSANYSSNQLVSNIVVRPRYTFDLGFQRRFFNDMGVLKVAIDDIFKTGCSGAYAKYGNVDIDVQNRWDSRRLNISFSYRFGKSKFTTRSNRTTASSEEQSRSSK